MRLIGVLSGTTSHMAFQPPSRKPKEPREDKKQEDRKEHKRHPYGFSFFHFCTGVLRFVVW